METKSMRILIADDEPKVRFALRVALERQPGSKTVGEATDAADLLAQAQSVCPDLLLLDWDLPETPAPELLSELHRICRRLKVIVLSEKFEAEHAALVLGADAFVSKADPPDHLLRAVSECWHRWEVQSKADCESSAIS
jgi:DNA-binding NarL/FixJ family response regulator